jgi:hypothetical protein
MLLQPETRLISEFQLANEVCGIYVGFIMVEKWCAEADETQVLCPEKVEDNQSQALVALYRTLLNEHHDFFLASICYPRTVQLG